MRIPATTSLGSTINIYAFLTVKKLMLCLHIGLGTMKLSYNLESNLPSNDPIA